MTEPYRCINVMRFYKIYKFYVGWKKISEEEHDEHMVKLMEERINKLIELNPDYAKQLYII